MKQVVMCACAGCNEEHVEAFEELMKGKNVEFKRGCIQDCGIKTPACRVDGVLVQADTVEELAKLV